MAICLIGRYESFRDINLISKVLRKVEFCPFLFNFLIAELLPIQMPPDTPIRKFSRSDAFFLINICIYKLTR